MNFFHLIVVVFGIVCIGLINSKSSGSRLKFKRLVGFALGALVCASSAISQFIDAGSFGNLLWHEWLWIASMLFLSVFAAVYTSVVWKSP